jgi:hypothetical protein
MGRDTLSYKTGVESRLTSVCNLGGVWTHEHGQQHRYPGSGPVYRRR